MALPKVQGAKVRGGRYYLNLRVPPDLAEHYSGRTHLESSLGTADPQVARQGVILAQARMIELAHGARKREVLAEAVANLPPDQRAVFDEAGSVERLQEQFERTDKARAFLMAGGALTESELQGEDPTIGETAMAEATLKAELGSLDRTANTEAKTLRAVGRKVKSPTAFGLRELITALAPLTGVRSDTVQLQNRIATRFIEYHGDLPLAELTIGHLREFAEAYRDLPANLRSPALRDMNWCIRITDAGEGQKVKNESSVRTLPLHRSILDAGFIEFATARAADDFLFVHDSGDGLRPMKADKRGRVAPTYSKRFSHRLRKELKITDKRLTFHSFRHRWEDAAEEADMPQTHRRDLAGRSKKGDSQANYGEGPRMAALRCSLDRIDPTAD